MNQGIPSRTAYQVALMRAAHQLFDSPKIFNDPMALRIIGSRGASRVQAGRKLCGTRLHKYLRAIVVARSQYAENELAAAMRRGVRQYVILGAGLDTFAYRNPYGASGLKVFELDHPATQAWKRGQLDEAKIAIPENVRFCPVDFENQSLAAQLEKAGFAPDEPACFSWLGVTMYLAGQTVMATMGHIASFCLPGTVVVFDYVTPPLSQGIVRRLVFRLLAKTVAKAGEPWQGFFRPGQLAKGLEGAGYSEVEDISPERINELFFKDRADGLRAGRFGHLMKAVVSGADSVS